MTVLTQNLILVHNGSFKIHTIFVGSRSSLLTMICAPEDSAQRCMIRKPWSGSSARLSITTTVYLEW